MLAEKVKKGMRVTIVQADESTLLSRGKLCENGCSGVVIYEPDHENDVYIKFDDGRCYWVEADVIEKEKSNCALARLGECHEQ